MPQNRVKELRRARGLSSERLAEIVGISQGHMSRIENGVRGLSLPMAEQIAMALETDVQDVLGLNRHLEQEAKTPRGGVSEDAEPYRPGPDDPTVTAPAGMRVNVDPWRITSDALDQIDIRAGDIVLVDISAAAVESVRPLSAVIVQLYAAGEMTATTLLRQFVPPNLLITNSSKLNAQPLSLERDPVAIKGVIVGPQLRFRQ